MCVLCITGRTSALSFFNLLSFQSLFFFMRVVVEICGWDVEPVRETSKREGEGTEKSASLMLYIFWTCSFCFSFFYGNVFLDYLVMPMAELGGG